MTDKKLIQEEIVMIIGALKYENGVAVPREWTLDRIREEICRLDEITGLRGRDIPCSMRQMKDAWGIYYPSPDGNSEKNMRFEFDTSLFTEYQGPGWGVLRIDTVHHEYAHYYCSVVLNDKKMIHRGETWKESCRAVDCFPTCRWPKHYAEFLEHLDSLYPNSIAINPANFPKDFRMSYEDAVWTLVNHPILLGSFFSNLTMWEQIRPPITRYITHFDGPQVLLQVKRYRTSADYRKGSDLWIYEPKFDTRAETFEKAIIEMAYKVLSFDMEWWK